MSNRFMYDTDGPASDIPKTAKAVAGYMDGAGNYEALVKGFPHAQHLPISIHGAQKAKCFDMENGALTFQAGVNCAKREIAAGRKYPWLYYSVSNRPAVMACLHSAGIKPHEVIHFGAHYGVGNKLPKGYDALQNVAAGYGATGHWDRSILAKHIPGWDDNPQHSPAPQRSPFYRAFRRFVRRWQIR